jgi:hypothetical protein
MSGHRCGNGPARRTLTRNRTTPTAVLGRARTLPRKDCAAVVTGAVHAADQLHPEQAHAVVDAALPWGQKAPRKAALEQLTAWGEHERALSLAANDPDASIRARARKPPPRAAFSTDQLSPPISIAPDRTNSAHQGRYARTHRGQQLSTLLSVIGHRVSPIAGTADLRVRGFHRDRQPADQQV